MPLSPKDFTAKMNGLGVGPDQIEWISSQEQNSMPRVAFRPLVLIAILALMAVVVGAQAPVPQPEDQETARVVVEFSNSFTWLAPDRRRDRGQVVRQLHQRTGSGQILLPQSRR